MKKLMLSSALALLVALPASAEIDQTIYMDMHGQLDPKPLKLPFKERHPKWYFGWKVLCGVWKVSVGGAQIAAAFNRG